MGNAMAEAMRSTLCGVGRMGKALIYLVIGIPRVSFSLRNREGLEWLNLTARLALDGILFVPHQLRNSNSNIMMGLMLHHGIEERGSTYLLGGSAQIALGIYDCI